MQTIRLTITLDDTNLILEALGALPFARVHQLIGTIQAQATVQLQEAAQPPSDDHQPARPE
jgi:hypothetical protein